MSEPSKLATLAWRFACWSWMTTRRWRFFFWITPRWLSTKWQMYMFRRYAKHHPIELERQVREALAHNLARLKSEDERAAYIKWATEVMLHPRADNLRFSQSGPHR